MSQSKKHNSSIHIHSEFENAIFLALSNQYPNSNIQFSPALLRSTLCTLALSANENIQQRLIKHLMLSNEKINYHRLYRRDLEQMNYFGEHMYTCYQNAIFFRPKYR